MFIFEKQMPNGALARWHKAVKFEVYADSTHAVVNSYHAEEMEMISWQDTYVIPVSIKIETLADVEYILCLPSAPFGGGQIVPDDTATLESKKARVKAQLRLRRDLAEWAGVTTPEGMVDSDPDSQRKISGTVTMAMLGGENFSIEWRMKDNSIVTLNAAQTIALGVAVGQHVAACQVNKNTIDSLIEACTTVEELQAVDLEEGWP